MFKDYDYYYYYGYMNVYIMSLITSIYYYTYDIIIYYDKFD